MQLRPGGWEGPGVPSLAGGEGVWGEPDVRGGAGSVWLGRPQTADRSGPDGIRLRVVEFL